MRSLDGPMPFEWYSSIDYAYSLSQPLMISVIDDTMGEDETQEIDSLLRESYSQLLTQPDSKDIIYSTAYYTDLKFELQALLRQENVKAPFMMIISPKYQGELPYVHLYPGSHCCEREPITQVETAS